MIEITKTNEAKMVDQILGYLSRAEGNREAVSYLHSCLREDGWRHLGNLSDFISLLRRIGFTVEEGRNSRNQRRIEVSL